MCCTFYFYNSDNNGGTTVIPFYFFRGTFFFFFFSIGCHARRRDRIRGQGVLYLYFTTATKTVVTGRLSLAMATTGGGPFFKDLFLQCLGVTRAIDAPARLAVSRFRLVLGFPHESAMEW